MGSTAFLLAQARAKELEKQKQNKQQTDKKKEVTSPKDEKNDSEKVGKEKVFDPIDIPANK